MAGMFRRRTESQPSSTGSSSKRKKESALSAEEQMVQLESWLSITPTYRGSFEDFCADLATKSSDI